VSYSIANGVRRATALLMAFAISTAAGGCSAEPAEPARDSCGGKPVGDKQAVSAVRAEIQRTLYVELEPGARFVLVELGNLSEGTAPDPLPRNEQRVPLVASSCERVWTMVSSSEPELRALASDLVGKQLNGLVVAATPAGTAQPGSEPWCRVLRGQEAILGNGNIDPPWAWSEIARRRQKAILAPLGAARNFFGAPDTLPRATIEDATPLDAHIKHALLEIRSAHGLEFALDQRMYFFATLKKKEWRRDPDNFPMLDWEVRERAWQRDPSERLAAIHGLQAPAALPDGSLVELFWMTSPTRARASIRALYERDPDRAMAILRIARGDDAVDLLLELTARDRGRWLTTTIKSLAAWGDERSLHFMRTERQAAAGIFLTELDETIARIEMRASLGVTDGLSLGRYLYTHRAKGPTPSAAEYRNPFWGMRLVVSGTNTGSCDLRTPLGSGVELRVDVDCDAESYTANPKLGAVVTATGTLGLTSVHDRHVQISLENARVERGGVRPREPDALEGAPAPEPEPAAASNEPEPPFGCSCTSARHHHAGPGALALPLALLALLARRQRRFTSGA